MLTRNIIKVKIFKNKIKMDLKAEECDKITAKDECTEIEISLNLFQYLSSDEFNVQNLCRICLSVNNIEMYSVVHSEDSDKLPELFSSFTAIHVLPNDGLPTNICNVCKMQLINSHEFKTKCVKADQMLRSLLKVEFVAKEECCDEVIRTKVNKEQNDIDGSNLKDFKEENEDMTEDVQYLEDLSDDETLCILQGAERSKEKQLVQFSTTSKADSKSLLKEIKKKKKSTVCTLCSKRFPNIKALSNHNRRNHSNAKLPHACNYCKETFSSDHDLKLHLPLHSRGPVWACIECEKEFKGRALLRRHVARHMSMKRWACEACGKSFTELYALRRHTRTHTGQRVEKRHACHLCDKRYGEACQLAAHISRHSGVRPCVCDICGKAFPTARLLASHRLVHTDSKPFACQYCDKRFRHESTRSTHHRTHTGEKPYVCTVCGKTFIQNSNLTLHMRTHTGERPYRCETCGRKFSSGSTLKNHVRTHTGEKPYSCSECGKKFARMDMSAHMRQHTGERPFECSVCYRKFITAARLREHCRIHTGEKPFECAMCSQKFATKSHMVKHLKSHDTKKQRNREAVIIRHTSDRASDKHFDLDKEIKSQIIINNSIDTEDQSKIDVDDGPLEITQEYILPDEDAQSELIVVDDTQNSFQNAALCLTTGGGNYSNDVNLVAVNEGEVRMLEGTTVKLYQLDQSLVQIHSSAGQVTISKITSKMTANF